MGTAETLCPMDFSAWFEATFGRTSLTKFVVVTDQVKDT
jgi:hypothetical protein